jgi:hypothetical protein
MTTWPHRSGRERDRLGRRLAPWRGFRRICSSRRRARSFRARCWSSTLRGIEIGCAEYDEGPTGCTVFHFAERASLHTVPLCHPRSECAQCLKASIQVEQNGDRVERERKRVVGSTGRGHPTSIRHRRTATGAPQCPAQAGCPSTPRRRRRRLAGASSFRGTRPRKPAPIDEVERAGLEPATPSLQSWCSPN